MGTLSLDDAEFRRIIGDAANAFAAFVLPLYEIRDGRPILRGTGFFVRSDRHTYLVSAAHVFDNVVASPLYCYSAPKVLVRLEGKLTRSTAVIARAEDRADVGVLRLDQASAPPFPTLQKAALPISDLRPAYLPRAGKLYAVIGFPASRNAAEVSVREINARPFAHLADTIPESEYSTFRTSPADHIIIPFTRKKLFNLFGRRVHGPNPQGLSGAPVIVLLETDGDRNQRFQVVGLLIEYHRGGRDVLIATDVSKVIGAISHGESRD